MLLVKLLRVLRATCILLVLIDLRSYASMDVSSWRGLNSPILERTGRRLQAATTSCVTNGGISSTNLYVSRLLVVKFK